MHLQSNPVTGNMLHTLPTTAGVVVIFFISVLEPNMPHCLRQQLLAQTARTPHLHKSELPGSSLSRISISSPLQGRRVNRLPCFSYIVLDPNMTHCLRQQPLAQTARTPHLHKPELPGSSLSPFFNLLARSYIQANTGFPLFGPCPFPGVWPLPRNSEWFLSFGPTIRHAIASTPESAATAGYLLLVCRSQTLFRLAKLVFPINTYSTCRLE